MHDPGAAQAIALSVMAEGSLGLAQILMRLAQREVQVEQVFGARLGGAGQGGERRLQSGDLGRAQFHRLQIGQAPPGLPQRGLAGDGLAIGADRAGLFAQRFQHMAKVLPHLRLAGIAGEQPFIQAARPALLAQMHQHGGEDEIMAGIVHRRGGQRFGMAQCIRQPVELH